MRKTKIMSMLLALAMVLSCFSGMALAEETATVAITQNGMALDGLDGMPLSFSPIVTFENPLAEGTDLSGITLTDGEAVLNPTVTQGAVTDGVFTTATVVMPVLTNGTEYTLNVPAISDNDAYSATFKTVEGAYILKEDFNGDIKSDFYQRSELTSRIDSSFLKDTGTDGKVDSVKYTLSLHPTIHFPTNIATAGMNEVVLDTRIMFTAKDDAHRVGDGSIFSGDDNSGHLIKILGVSGNDRAYVRTNDSGELTYGDTAGYGLNTGYKVYENTWYNISIALNSTRKQMKVSIYDDAGNYYCGDWTKTSYGGREISYINKIMLPYGSFISSVTDYIYVYDNAASSLDEISATYGDGKDLNGAKGVEKTFDATLKFENPVTGRSVPAPPCRAILSKNPKEVANEAIAIYVSVT